MRHARPTPCRTFPNIGPQMRKTHAIMPDFVDDLVRTIYTVQTREDDGEAKPTFNEWAGEVFHSYAQQWLNEYLFGLSFAEYRRLSESGATLEQIEAQAKRLAIARRPVPGAVSRVNGAIPLPASSVLA